VLAHKSYCNPDGTVLVHNKYYCNIRGTVLAHMSYCNSDGTVLVHNRYIVYK